MKVENGKIKEIEKDDLKCFELTIKEGVKSIDKHIMQELYRSVCHMSLPMSLLRIEDGAFEDFEQLREVILSENVEYLGKRAFKNNRNHLMNVKFNDKLEIIEEEAFMNCTWLKSQKEIIIPKNVKTIKARAFAGCANFETLVLDGGIDEIDPTAFTGCKRLKKVIINMKNEAKVFENRGGFLSITATKGKNKIINNRKIYEPGSFILHLEPRENIGEIIKFQKDEEPKLYDIPKINHSDIASQLDITADLNR